MINNEYFAAREDSECVAALDNKVEYWNNTLESNGYLNKLRNMFSAYHGMYMSDSLGDAHQITFGGDDEELTEIAINHIRNFGQIMLTMTTASRPAMECRAVNTDYQSLIQTQLGNGLLDYYMREKRLEEYFKDATELAVVLGTGWIKLGWNQSLGKLINEQEIKEITEALEQDPELEMSIPAREYEGDVEFNLLSPLDVVVDLTKEGREHDWVICRSFKNRFDLIAKYPELEDELMGIESKENSSRLTITSSLEAETDDIPVWEFYHNRTEALPNGKYMFYASEDAIFYSGDLPYRRIPLFAIQPSRVLGSPLGYTNLFDILPIQDAMNAEHSSILSNHSAFAVQNILNPTGCNIDVNQISGSLNIIDYNPQAGKPEALNLTHTPREVFDYIGMLNQAAETISGMNSVVRGNPEANLRSGSAIAMIQSNAIQFMSGLQAEYTFIVENVGLCLLEILQDFADSPRIANIVGESGKSYVKEFKGDDLRSINRVIVDSANPMTKTVAGRTQMADNLLQYQLLKDPKQYINIINTGKLEVGIEGEMHAFNALRSENEELLLGRPQRVIITDNHMEHIQSHKIVLDDPKMRENEELANVVLAHIQEHINMLQNGDPNVLMALGQQPIPPSQPPAGQAMPPQDMQNPTAMPPQEQAVEQTGAQPQEVQLPEGVEAAETPLTPAQNLEMNGRM